MELGRQREAAARDQHVLLFIMQNASAVVWMCLPGKFTDGVAPVGPDGVQFLKSRHVTEWEPRNCFV
jgi:hypothetical protein